MKRLVVHQEAEIEFTEAVRYYELRSAGLGLDFVTEAEACFSSIQKYPARFSFHKRLPIQRCHTRRFPYIVFFREFEDHISIVAIAHAKRKPDYWQRRNA